LFDPLRIDQYRGISAFHAAINDCTDIYDIINFEKMAAKVASSQSAVVRRNNNNASDLSSLSTDQDINGNTVHLEAIESGKISYLEPGEDIVFPEGPSRPSGAFAEFHKILLRNICLGLGIPYSFAVDPSSMSGPTARLEMQQAGRTFRRYQKLLDDKVLRPIKNIVIADAVARGLIKNNVGSRTTKGIFNFGANVSIDLGRESASAISEFKTGLRTAADIYAERGQDFESAMRQRAIEAKLIKDLAGEYEVSADTISDIAAEGLTRDSQQPQVSAKDGEQKPAGKASDQDMLGGASLNGAQVASLINVINAVAMGAVSKEGAVSIITAAFPTITPDQARAIIAGVNIGTTIPTTKEEKQQIAKDQEGDSSSGGSTPPPTEPTTPPVAPSGTSQKKSSLEILESLDPASIKMLIAGMMGGIELAKYDGIDFTPPQGARDAAKRALDVRDGKPASQRGMTPVGIARARDLMNGVKLSPDTARRMKAFFDRHEVDKKGATWDEQGKGWQAWNGWGGDAGYAWARKVVGQMEARDKKTEFVAGRDCGQDDGGTFGPDNVCAVGYGRPPLKGGYTPTRPGGKFPKGYKRPTPQGGTGKKPQPPKPLPPKPLPPKPLPPKPLPPPPPPGSKKPTDGKPSIDSKFPNATKAYDSKQRASLEEAFKQNKKQLDTVRERIIKDSAVAQKELDAEKEKYQATQKSLKESREKLQALLATQDAVAATDQEKYNKTKIEAEKENERRESLKKELQERQKAVEDARVKMREIGFKAIREDMLEVNKQDGFSSEQLSKATEDLKQKQQTAIEPDKRSIKISKNEFATQEREKAQASLRSIFNPHIHSDSLSKPITYSLKPRESSRGSVVQLSEGTRIPSLVGIRINRGTEQTTILHEYGHQVEAGNVEAHDLCAGFLKKRTANEKVEKFKKLFGAYNYRPNEVGSADNFEKAFIEVLPESDTRHKAYYTGKRYNDTPIGGTNYLANTEVYSMGIELLRENPVGFAKADPEWFDLVSGIATGRLLKRTRGLE
jgi:hypothetical protein